MEELSLKQRLDLSPEERRRRYQQAVKPFIDKNFKNGVASAENYIGTNDSPTAGLTKENFARSTEGYAANNDGTYRYRATRELGIPDQIDQNPKYAAYDRMQYYLIDHPNAFDSPRELKTANDWWGQIYTIMSQDSRQGNALAEQAKYFSTQYGNPLYNPYQASTLSKDIKNLFGLESFSKEWVAENYNLLNALELTDAGNPKSPSDKSTPEQILAYHYSKILDAEANTLKAEQELADLKAQISSKVANAKLYGTGQSVDDIYKSLEMDDYTTLKAMEDNKLKAQPYTLTRAVNYNDDVVYAMIQAAMDADDSDISGITDFTEAGANYSNNKYVDSQEKREQQLYQKFYEDERERYRLEQDAVLTGDTSAQEKYKAMEASNSNFAFIGTGDAKKVKTNGSPLISEKQPKTKLPIGMNSPQNIQFSSRNIQEETDRIRNLDADALEAEIASLKGRLEDVDSAENAMPMEEYTDIEDKIEALEMELRQHNNLVKLDEYAAIANNSDFAEYASRGAQMENTSAAHEQYSDTYADPRAPHTALDETEIGVYNYLLAKEGEAAADEYIQYMQETVNARQGKKVAEAGDDNILGQLLYNYSAGVVSSLEGAYSAFSDNVRPVGAADYARSEMAQNNSNIQNALNDISQSIGNMTPGILLSSLTGGALGNVYMGISASGNAYQDAMRSGDFSTKDARAYAMLVGASEGMLSYLLGGVSKLGGGKSLETLTRGINKIDNVFMRTAAKLGKSAASEGFEEYLQAQIEPLLQNWILGMENDFNLLSEDAMYSALMGACTAGFLEGAGIAIDSGFEVRNEREIGRLIIESSKKNLLIGRAKQSNNADVRQAAEALEAGTVRATEGMIGQLAIEYKDAGGDISFLSEPIEPEVQPTVTGITTDYDTAQALTRAMRGEVTESDLDLLEKSVDIPNHEETVKEISAAAKEFSGINKRYTDKEEQLQQLKQDIEAAQSKVDEAKAGLSMHLRGVVRMQNGEVLGRELVAKQHIESQIQQLEAEAERVRKSGLDPVDQNKKLVILRQQLSESQTKVDELTAGHRESTVFQGQITNTQKGLDAANRNYAVAEAEMDRIYYEYRAAADEFRERVSNAVNTAFGQNALGMLEQTANNILANESEQQRADFLAALTEELGGNPDPEAVAMLADFLQLPEAQEALSSQRTEYEARQGELEQDWLQAKDERQTELDNAPGALLRALNAIKADKQKDATKSDNEMADARVNLLLALKSIGSKRVQEKQARNDAELEKSGQGASYLGRSRVAAIRNESEGSAAKPIAMSNQAKHRSRAANKTIADTVAANLVRNYDSRYGSNALSNEIASLYNYISESANDYDEVAKRIDSIAENLLHNTRKADDETYAAAKEEFKKARVKLNDSEWSAIEYAFGNRTAFRKDLVKNRIGVVQDGVSLTDFLAEIESRYPWLVNTNVSEGEMVDQFVNAINELYTPGVTDYDGDIASAKAEISNYIQDAYYGIEANEPGAYTQDAGTPGAGVQDIEGIEYSTVEHAVPVGQPATQATKTSKQASKNKRKKKLLSAQMIIEQASADFEMPTRSGIEASFDKTRKDAKAYQNHRSASMRLPQDIGNFAHELGEFLNKKYRFSTKHADMAEAMVYKLPNEFFENYTEDSLKSEAVAEMVYLYMVNPEAAQEFGGAAYDTFMKELSRADKRALNKMQGRVQKYMTQTVDEINRANSSRSIENLDQRTASAKFRDAVHGLVYDYVDNFEPAMRLDRQTTKEKGFVTQDKHVEKKLSDFRRGNTIAGHMLTDTLIDHTGAVVGEGFMSCLDGLDANGYAQVSQYLADMRALDWLNHTTVQKIDGVEKIVPSPKYVYDPATTSKEAIQQRVNNTSNEVKAAAEKIWDWYRNFEQLWLVNSGRMTQQELENLWKAEPHYVPFKRVIDYENSSSKAINRGLEQMSNQIQKLTGNGSSRDFIEPLTAIMQSVINLTNGTLRNEVGKTIVWQLRNTDLLGNMATITPQSMGAEVLFNGDKDFIDIENAFANQSKAKPDGTNLYGVVENGRVTWIQINDPLLLELMESPNPGNMASWMSKLAKLTSTANAMATTFNTKFQLRNLKKDISTAWRNSPTGNPLAFIADEAISAAQLLKHVAAPGSSSQEVLEWIAMGGMDDGRFSANISKQSAEKIYDLANPNLFKVFKDKVNETIGLFESATRLNMYKQGKKYALAEGQSAVAARAAGATASRMGTTDFNRRGARMAGFSAVARFGNAIIEGSFQSVRNLVDKTTDVTSNNMKRKWSKVGADFLTRSAVLAMASQFFMNDREKEQFKRMDPSLKYSGMVFPWENVSGIKGDLLIVPYPNDPVSSILSIGTAVVEGVLTGGVWDEVKGAAEILWDTLNPFGSPIFGPVLDIYKNETWYGSDLVSGSLEKRHPLYQYDEDTSTLARAMSSSIYNISSKVTNGKAEVAWSPIVIDYVLQQYGGAAYGALEGFEAGVRQLIETDGNIGAVAKNQLYRFVDNISSGYHRNMITGSDVSQLYYDGSDLIESVIYEQNQGVVHPDLAYGLTDDEIMQAYTDAKRLKDEYFKEINQNITELYTQMDELAENPALDDWEKERQRSQLREQVYDYQLAGIAYVDAFRAKYCGDSYSGMTPRAVDSNESKGYAAFNSADLPESFVSQQNNPVIAKLRSYYEQDTSKTTFKPTYPPDFVDADNVLTEWDAVDNTTKRAMEQAWTTTYIQNLTENGFASITDYKRAKEIASDAKRAANKEAKSIYTIKYRFRED